MAFAGDDPSVVTMKEGVTIATTPGGNPVAVFTDENSNIFLIDPNGNLYYDTGDPQIGFYFVSPRREPVARSSMYQLIMQSECVHCSL
jgi:hypothetical protein